jgi:hypothetical protein
VDSAKSRDGVERLRGRLRRFRERTGSVANVNAIKPGDGQPGA